MYIHVHLKYGGDVYTFSNVGICSLLPGNQILISKYLARRGVVMLGGWSNGSGWQQTTTTTVYVYTLSGV